MKKNLVFEVLKVVITCSLFIIGFVALVFKDAKPIILGYIFGASINILTFYLLNDTAAKIVTMPAHMAKKKAYANYMVRFSIYFIVISISAIADYLNLLATFFGLTMVKNSIYILCAFDKNFLK